MKLVKQTQFVKIFFDEQSKIMESSWNEGNGEMNKNDFEQTITEVANSIKTYSPVYYLPDDSNRLFVYEIEMQNWVAQILAEACIIVGVKKFAIVQPRELIAQLSTEQTVDEAGEIPFDIRYFNDRETALDWLKN